MSLSQTIRKGVDNVRTHWKTPMKGRYMPYREIAAYSGGGIGAYMIITLGNACLLSMGNTLISSTLGVGATDMYLLYVIAILINIPFTGLRATIIDNTRNKAGKYRPYIVRMAIPSAIICNLIVWFPYDKLSLIVGEGMIFGREKDYVAKCAIILILNIALNFIYYFFYDGYENLIHVLSPNTQERTDVQAIKSVVYSFAPTIVNLFTPIIARNLFHTNTTDIRVYRFLYPILAVLGVLLCIIVYKYTEEKIVQARTHVVQIKFTDALRAVAKNKYFWIISLAGWIGFLESAYANILNWLYNYGGACNGNVYGLVVTLYGNASLWGMIAAPFCIRKWGKKAVLVTTNLFNIVFILCMLPITQKLTGATIWMVLCCMYLNAFMGSFSHILNPAIQADIRDYQQYKSGERIDGAFATIGTIGTLVSLATSSVLPFIYERGGITKENAAIVTSRPEILNRVIDGKTVGQLLAEQLANGQDNYNNAYSALYDPDILLPLLHVLILFSAFGALMNVIPYFWYDFNEKKQKSVIRVLKIRAMFEDFGNGVLKDKDLVETVELIKDAKEKSTYTPKDLDKKSYKIVSDKLEKEKAKNQYKEDKEYNDEIDIAKFVCEELNKFHTPVYAGLIPQWKAVYGSGLEGLLSMDMREIREEIRTAKAMSKATPADKEARSLALETAKNKKYAYKMIKKHYKNGEAFEKPDYNIIQGYYEREDAIDLEMKALYQSLADAKKSHTSIDSAEVKAKIKALKAEKKSLKPKEKAESDLITAFSVAAKPYLSAEKMLVQMENYSHLDDIFALYDEAKERVAKA